jgi:hypothetical protein
MAKLEERPVDAGVAAARALDDAALGVRQARMQAFLSLPGDQRQLVMSARRIAGTTDPGLATSDDSVVEALVPEVPGAAEVMKEMGRR